MVPMSRHLILNLDCFLPANLPDESITPMSSVCKPGVYFGYAQVYGLSGQEGKVHPMVMSLGWNPFYKNERLTAVCVRRSASCHHRHSGSLSC